MITFVALFYLDLNIPIVYMILALSLLEDFNYSLFSDQEEQIIFTRQQNYRLIGLHPFPVVYRSFRLGDTPQRFLFVSASEPFELVSWSVLSH